MSGHGTTRAECPLTVGIQDGEVVLFARTERLGVLLAPTTARELAASLVAASDHVDRLGSDDEVRS